MTSARFLLSFTAVLTLLSACRNPQPTLDASTTDPNQTTVIRRAQSATGENLFEAPAGFNLPAGNASLTDTARLLAGMSASGRDSYEKVRGSNEWLSHQRRMDELWNNFGWRHEGPILAWSNSQIGDLQRDGGLFYPFSGPDFLFAHTFFPKADTLILCGLEPCEPLPPLHQLSGAEMAAGLGGLVTSVSSVMQFSFFITKDMRRDLVSTRFRGVLPLILAFMARTGHQIESVELVALDGNGVPVISQTGPGLMIRAHGPDGAFRRVFYFRQDLSDGSMNANHPLLKFASSTGQPPAFVKSASYLMHDGGFSVIKNYLLTQCRAIVQDPSGIPYRVVRNAGLRLNLYGNYTGTLEMFSEHNQPDLIEAYARREHNAQPLNFGVGYMYNPERTCLMVGRR
jgi:hypothetical protein